MRATRTIGIFCMLIMAASLAPAAESPIDVLKAPLDEITSILRDPRYKDGAHFKEQREKMWVIARRVFDFEAIARGTLKRYRWKEFTDQQRKAFVDAFTVFIGTTYFNQIQGEYKNETVEFLSQEMQSEKKALVKTKIVRETTEIPIDYSMWNRGGSWRIFNVYVEGASLLGNYRIEFERELMKGSPDALIESLRQKTETLKQQMAGKAS